MILKAIAYFLIGAAVMAYSLEIHSFIVGYIGFSLMCCGGVYMLIYNCDRRDDLMNGRAK